MEPKPKVPKKAESWAKLFGGFCEGPIQVLSSQATSVGPWGTTPSAWSFLSKRPKRPGFAGCLLVCSIWVHLGLRNGDRCLAKVTLSFRSSGHSLRPKFCTRTGSGKTSQGDFKINQKDAKGASKLDCISDFTRNPQWNAATWEATLILHSD